MKRRTFLSGATASALGGSFIQGALARAVDVSLHGSVAPGFEAVRTAFLSNFDPALATPETGATTAVIHRGKLVVDLYGGFADEARKRPWARDTIVNVYSTTKAVASACTTLLESRGLLDYAAPVARYWPEFAANGKANISVETMLSHQAGLSGVRTKLSLEDLFDHDKVARILAAAEPLWPPGTQAGYHAITWGFLVNELVRRVDGRTIGKFLRDEWARPLGADVFIGLPEEEDHRVAEMLPPLGEPTQSLAEPTELLKLTLLNPLIEPRVPNRRDWRAAELPSMNGTTNALALARLFGAFALDGTFEGRRWMPAGAVARASHPRWDGVDVNIGIRVRWGAGFYNNNDYRWYGPNVAAFGHSGWGGSCVFADPLSQLTVAYVPNRMDANLQGDPRSIRIVNAIYDCIKRQQ